MDVKKKLLTITLCVNLIALLLFVQSMALATPLPDTGQTKCYNNTEERPCPNPGEPFYGQDVQYAPCNPHSHTDLGNGIVRDNVTGRSRYKKVIIHGNMVKSE